VNASESTALNISSCTTLHRAPEGGVPAWLRGRAHDKSLSLQVAACEAAIANAVAQLKQLVDSTAAALGDALDPITFRLHAQEVRPWLPANCNTIPEYLRGCAAREACVPICPYMLKHILTHAVAI
jgi:hypothetical protein